MGNMTELAAKAQEYAFFYCLRNAFQQGFPPDGMLQYRRALWTFTP